VKTSECLLTQGEAERAKPDNKWRNVEIVIVCDMLLTGFDARIVETMYLDKGIRDHARCKRLRA
jgi:type I restriction enzyme, R subunit